MEDDDKTKEQLIDELAALRQKVFELDRKIYIQDHTVHAVRESEERYRALVEGLPDAVAIDSEDRFVFINSAGARLLAADHPTDIIGRSIGDILPPKYTESEKIRILESGRTGTSSPPLEEKIMRLDGKVIDAEIRCIPVTYLGKPATQVLIRDITRRKLAEGKLRLHATVFSNTTEGIMITDRNAVLLSVNRAFEQITGYSAEEAIGRDPRILKSGQHDKAFYEELWAALLEKQQWRGEIWNKRKNGAIYPQDTIINAVKDETGRVVQYVAIFDDITTRKQTENILLHLSTMDGLTGLANRHAFDEFLESEWRRALRIKQHLSVILMDVDCFSKYNDTYGHLKGDVCLQNVGYVMQKVLHRSGDMAARYGGEEFVTVLPTTSGLGAVRIAEKIRLELEALRIPHETSGVNAYVTLSMGVAAAVPDIDMSALDLVNCAEEALCRAKREGRNRVVFHTGSQCR